MGIAVPVGDPSQLLMLMLNCLYSLQQSWRLNAWVMAGGFLRKIRRAVRLSVRDWGYLLTAVKELLLAWLRHGTQPMTSITVAFERPL